MVAQMVNKKMELIQWLSLLEDTSIIEKLLKFKTEETCDWWDSVPQQEKQSLEKGISDADEEKLESHRSVRKIYEKWL